MPPQIGRLTNLSTLNMTYCKELTELPPQLGDLVALTALDLSQCAIDSAQALAPLAADAALVELELAKNPLCKRHGARWRRLVLEQLPQVRILNHVAIGVAPP